MAEIPNSKEVLFSGDQFDDQAFKGLLKGALSKPKIEPEMIRRLESLLNCLIKEGKADIWDTQMAKALQGSGHMSSNSLTGAQHASCGLVAMLIGDNLNSWYPFMEGQSNKIFKEKQAATLKIIENIRSCKPNSVLSQRLKDAEYYLTHQGVSLDGQSFYDQVEAFKATAQPIASPKRIPTSRQPLPADNRPPLFIGPVEESELLNLPTQTLTVTRDPKVQFELAGIDPMIDKAKEKGGIPWPKIIGGVVTTVIAIPTINLVSAMYRGGVTYEATKTANPVTIHVNPAQTGTNPDRSPKLESLITTTDPKIIVVDSKGKPGTNTNNDIFAKSQLTTRSYAVVITSPEGDRVSLSDIKRKVTVKLAEQGINRVDIGPLSNGLYGVTLGNQNQLGAVTSVLTDLKVGEVTLKPADGTTSATTSQQSLLEQAQDKLGDNTRAKEEEIHSKNAGIAALASGAIALLIFGINKGLKKLEDRSKQSNNPKSSDQS